MYKNNYRQLDKLVERAQAGDEDAFCQIYELTAKAQYIRICQIIGNTQEAQDILQDTYVVLHRNLDKITPVNAFLAYLNKLSYYLSKNAARSQMYRENHFTTMENLDDIPDDKNNPLDLISRDEVRRTVCKAVAVLPERERDMIWMHYYQKMTLKSIAFSMGVSLNTVKRLHRSAKRELMETLSKQGIRSYVFLPFQLAAALKGQAASWPCPPLKEEAAGRHTARPSSLLSRFVSQAAVWKLIVISSAFAGSAALVGHSQPFLQIDAVHTPTTWQKNAALVSVAVSPAEAVDGVLLEGDDSSKIKASQTSPGIWQAYVTKNGRYRAIASGNKKKSIRHRFEIACIDRTYPQAIRTDMKDGRLHVWFEENGSGLDEASVYLKSEDGIITRPESFSAKQNTATFLLAECSHTLYFSDKAGNCTSLPIEYEGQKVTE